ncbi:MAG: ABC transporter permease [Candidatus Aminicenantes bacterium]|nr:ABC transporter permease [Candidatus Aminicenantes bacterium]MDH5384977.1 ABC transporter permease [Candidatus Aminicenantes bacterium]
MWFTIKLAWRNLFRNKRRTFIAGTAIALGLASMMFTDAVMIGMKDVMIRSATGSFLGDAQIHRNEFRLTQEVEKTINNPDRITANLRKEEIVDRFTPRTLSFGMITSPANVSSVLFIGIDPETEKHLSQIDDVIREGNFFDEDNERDIVIGSKLADILEVTLGERVVITVSQAKSGDLSQEMFRVSGIYHFNIEEMDSGFAFVKLAKAQEMLGIGSNVHEIAIKFRDMKVSLQEDNPFWTKYSTDDNEAVSWLTILPQMGTILDMFWISLLFMAIILFGIVAFGIINTLFMSLYERLFEFGVLRAVGTRSSGVRRLIIYEAGALAVLSCIMGIILGFIFIFIVTKTGIDYRGIEITGTTIREILYPVFHIQQFIIYPIAVFAFTMLIGHYPAIVAGKMSISNALRKSL